MKIAIINGPNLNLLGQREPGIYGPQNFENYFEKLAETFSEIELTYSKSNIEGELVNLLHKSAENCDGIILNAAAYTHTSVAIGDAVAAIDVPVVEVHISNIYSRENFRQQSYIAPKAAGIMSGFGLDGYRLAVLHLLQALA